MVFGNRIEFCVISITIKRDRKMVVTVSWKQIVQTTNKITKYSDQYNKNMNMVDNLGNRYDHIAGGGAAYAPIDLNFNEPIYGWFEFGSPHLGAFIFNFYDDDQDVAIEKIVLLNPVILYKDFQLRKFSLVLEYRIQIWEKVTGEAGEILIKHQKMPECTIREKLAGPPEGKLKNILEIGEVEYAIYGYIDEMQNFGVREYLAVDVTFGFEAGKEPILLVTIPFENSQECIMDVSEMLATLQNVQP